MTSKKICETQGQVGSAPRCWSSGQALLPSLPFPARSPEESHGGMGVGSSPCGKKKSHDCLLKLPKLFTRSLSKFVFEEEH